VILIDANILLYSHSIELPQHAAAREWLDERLSARDRVGLPWASLLAFLRVISNPRAFARPEPIEEAWDQVRAWTGRRNVWIPEPTERHVEVLGELLCKGRIGGNLVTDAHLAALAIEHGLTLCSTDGDFARFKGLKWQNPLAQ